jgi:hypothetical protein
MDMADCCVVIDIEKEENSIMVLIVAVPHSIFFAEQSYCTVPLFLIFCYGFLWLTFRLLCNIGTRISGLGQ